MTTSFKIIFSCEAAIMTEPISKPTIDLAEPFPVLPSKEIIITGLLNFSFNLAATIPITPSCQSFPLIIMTGSLNELLISLRIFCKKILFQAFVFVY